MKPIMSTIKKGDSSSAKKDEVFSETRQDEGWAWVVVFAGILSITLSIGLYRSLGILLVELMEAFDSPITEASLLFSCYGISFTASALLLNTALGGVFHERALLVIATIIGSVGFVVAFFSTHVYHVTIGLGLCIGASSQSMIASSLSLVSRYFNKRLSIASSIVVSGTSIGVLVWPVCIRYLLDEFAYRGTCLILAGLTLNGLVCAALMRPFENTHQNKRCKSDQTQINENNKTSTDKPEVKIPNEIIIVKPEVLDNTEAGDKVKPPENGFQIHGQSKMTLSSQCNDGHSEFVKNPQVRQSTRQEIQIGVNGNANKRDQTDVGPMHVYDNAAFEYSHHGLEMVPKSVSSAQRARTSIMQTFVISMRKFVLIEENVKTEKMPIFGVFALELFKNPIFVLLMIFTCLNSLCSEYVVQFYPVITSELGFTKYQSAYLLSVVGISGLCGRPLVGILGDFVSNRYRILVVSQITLGIGVLLCRYALTFWLQVAYAVSVGLTYGVPYAFKVPIMRDFFNSKDIPKMVGINLFFSGIGIAGGNPLIAWLMSSTGGFIVPMYITMSLLVTNGFILLLMAALRSLKAKRRKSYDLRQENVL